MYICGGGHTNIDSLCIRSWHSKRLDIARERKAFRRTCPRSLPVENLQLPQHLDLAERDLRNNIDYEQAEPERDPAPGGGGFGRDHFVRIDGSGEGMRPVPLYIYGTAGTSDQGMCSAQFFTYDIYLYHLDPYHLNPYSLHAPSLPLGGGKLCQWHAVCCLVITLY